MRRRWHRDERGASPVIGAVLLVAIAIALVSLTAVLIFGTTDETPPAPTAKFEMTQADGGYVLEVTAGDTIDGTRVTIQGLADPDILAGREFGPGDSVQITPTERSIEIIWAEQAEDGVSYELQTSCSTHSRRLRRSRPAQSSPAPATKSSRFPATAAQSGRCTTMPPSTASARPGPR
jgi:flagellin-like protein